MLVKRVQRVREQRERDKEDDEEEGEEESEKERLESKPKHEEPIFETARALILSPTRELAL